MNQKVYRLIFFLFLSAIVPLNSSGQSCFDKLKSQPIRYDMSKPMEKASQQPFLKDLHCLLEVGLDSIDIEILFHESYFSNIYIDLINEIRNGEKKITYRNLLAVYMRIKSKYDYDYTILKFKLSRELRDTPAIYANYERTKNALLTTELDWFEEDYVALFEGYLFEHSDSTLNMLDLLDDYDRQQMEFDELLNSTLIPYKINVKVYSEESTTQNKPILLYFTGISSDAGEKLEQAILKNQEVLDQLKSNFIFRTHYVDDMRELKESEWVFYEKLNKTAKTIGEVNLFYQMEVFDMNAQPYFVALNNDQEVIGIGTYEDFSNSKDFLEFLTSIKSNFSKKD